MDPRLVKLPVHNHPLTISARFVHEECKGCDVTGFINGGYRCNEPGCAFIFFHKDCAEAPPEIIDHPSHPQHPLEMLNIKAWKCILCSLCGKRISGFGYHCLECKFYVDLACGMKPPTLHIERPKCHDHPLVFLKKQKNQKQVGQCEICKGGEGEDCFYACLECGVYFHVGCVNLSQEVNHPCHPKHPLKLLTSGPEHTCVVCGEGREGDEVYHCSLCNFSICLVCTKKPRPLSIEHHKTHEHQLFLLARHMSFVCNACGMQGDRSPYVCIQCGFVVHQTCIDLPRVININRHDHRVSFTYYLGPGYSNCIICRKSISQYNGAYSCSRCPNFAVHSRCATNKGVWDGEELEGRFDDDDEDVEPFKVVGENLIKHFSHEEHNLRLNKDNNNRDENSRCEACVLPLYSDPIYNCEECRFILHEKCANFPKKKRLWFSTKPFFLSTRQLILDQKNSGFWKSSVCVACQGISNGFMYTGSWEFIDVGCGSRSEPYIHDSHIHPLYDKPGELLKCNACQKESYGFNLGCDTCDFVLHISCADVPKVVKHSCDDHPLSLCYGEKASGKYWCDICEAETDPTKWFYTCFDCGVTVHIQCVLGDFSRLMPGSIISDKYAHGTIKFQAVLNNHNSRPFCVVCHYRCRAPIIVKLCDPYSGYICSRLCLQPFSIDKIQLHQHVNETE